MNEVHSPCEIRVPADTFGHRLTTARFIPPLSAVDPPGRAGLAPGIHLCAQACPQRSAEAWYRRGGGGLWSAHNGGQSALTRPRPATSRLVWPRRKSAGPPQSRSRLLPAPRACASTMEHRHGRSAWKYRRYARGFHSPFRGPPRRHTSVLPTLRWLYRASLAFVSRLLLRWDRLLLRWY